MLTDRLRQPAGQEATHQQTLPPAPAAIDPRLQPEVPLLDANAFAGVVANAPLVAFDLLVRDSSGAVLLGLRNNPPAQGCWFVPGGRIRKNETLDAAFARISRDELGLEVQRSASRFLGVYEHLYDTNFLGEPGAATHYIVLAHVLELEPAALRLPTSQHARYTWMQPMQLCADPQVHANVQAYFNV